MTGSAIRELAAARTAPLICAAFVENVIQIWNVATRQKAGEFAVAYDFGARNLALHPDGKSVVTGISRRSGRIASFKLPSGEQLWVRDRMRYPANLHFGRSGDYLFCTLDNRRVERIDARAGNTIDLFQKTASYFEGSPECVFTAPAGASAYLLRNGREFAIPRLTFAVLDIAFGADRFCLTESGGLVRCLDCQTDAERWRYTPEDGSHVLALHYNLRDGFFYGVLWQYEDGAFRRLVRFDPENGHMSAVCGLNSWAEAFSEATQQLITSSGDIIDLCSGTVAGKLDFPLMEYPDPAA